MKETRRRQNSLKQVLRHGGRSTAFKNSPPKVVRQPEQVQFVCHCANRKKPHKQTGFKLDRPDAKAQLDKLLASYEAQGCDFVVVDG